MIVRSALYERIASMRRKNPLAFWLWVAVAAAFLLYGQGSNAVEVDCSTFPVPPPEPFQIITQGSACGQTKSSCGSSGSVFPTIAALQAAIQAKEAPWACDSTYTRTISTLTQCEVSGANWGDVRWLNGTSPKHQPYKVDPGGDTTCAPVVPPIAPCSSEVHKVQGCRSATLALCQQSIPAGSCFMGCKVRDYVSWGKGVGTNEEADGTFHWDMLVRRTGDQCSAEDPQATAPGQPLETDPEPIAEADHDGKERCRTTAAGTEICTGNPYGENCGYFNGEAVCLGKTDPDECWVNGDTSRWCGSNAPTPPVPDNGTAGTKATPNDKVVAQGPSGTTNVYNYYNGGSVAGSSRAAGDNGANPNRTTSTNPSTGTIGTVDEGGGSGNGTGDEPGDFTGPELEEICTIEDCTGEFFQAISEGPLGQALTGQSFSTGGASCPAPTITGFGSTWTLDFHCAIFEDYRALFSALFLFGWTILAARIFLSA